MKDVKALFEAERRFKAPASLRQPLLESLS
jgi:hypothetical protein